MGKRGGKRGGGGRGRGRGGGRGGGRQTVRWDREDIVKSHGLFESYYNGILSFDDQEKEQFWAAFRRELPNSFRFTGSKGHALHVQALLKDRYIPEITAINFQDEPVPPPTQLSWFPNQLAWQMTTPKAVVRSFPPFASFRKFLVSETAVGNISRQEIVSMIPPLLLDVKPGMTVLDLCAAPGSKSAQLIEMIHGGEESRIRKVLRDIQQQKGREASPDGMTVEQNLQEEGSDGDWSDDGRSTGLLIANDVDSKRAHLLVHQVKRLNSPNLVVTNHDASAFPSIKLHPRPQKPGQQVQGRYLKFDRILADVPCSGDGTGRKNLNVWKDWTPTNGLGLHSIQVRILVRALQMLKVGGRVVYSTCSMNPIENEAVVAAAIERCGGLEKVELLDSAPTLPGLRRANGLKSWKVVDKHGELWSSWEEVVSAQEEGFEDHREKIMSSMFPPDPSQELPLDHCMRVYPHHQDTGAFFISILEKRSEIKARTESLKSSTSSAPVTAMITEIESKTESDPPGDYVESADQVLAPSKGILEAGDPTPAELQNKEANGLASDLSPRKRKPSDEPASPQPPKRAAIDEDETGLGTGGQSLTAPNKMASRKSQSFEEPFKYLDPDDEVLKSIISFYELDPRFPRERYMVRNVMGIAAKKIYFTSALVKEILVENDRKGLKFVHAGVNMFVRQEVQSPEVCRWRIQTDGMPLIEAWVGERRVIRLHSRETFRKLLVEMFPKLGDDAWRDLGEIGQSAYDMSMGCCVLRIEKSAGDDGFSERMVYPIWRSRHALNLMLPKEDRKAMLLRVYNEEVPLMDHSKDRFKKKEPATNGSDAMEMSVDTKAPEEDERGTTSEEDAGKA